jgi:hypothetical protein
MQQGVHLLVDGLFKRCYNKHIDSNKERDMGYKVVADKYEMDQMRVKYGPRKGLEGPFNFSGRVLYYDNKEGQYYDPTTDFYVEDSEMTLLRDGFLKQFG